MIDPKSRSLEWILESCRTNKVSDPTLMEKTIRAFSLLEAGSFRMSFSLQKIMYSYT